MGGGILTPLPFGMQTSHVLGLELPGYSLNGCNVPAMMNLVDIAPSHCGTLMGLCNGFSSFAGFVVPLATTAFTQDDPSDPANWRKLFFLRDPASLTSAGLSTPLAPIPVGLRTWGDGDQSKLLNSRNVPY